MQSGTKWSDRRELTPAARRRSEAQRPARIAQCGHAPGTHRARTVLFPAAFIQNAGYKVSLRVQSERSERLRELTPAARRRIQNIRGSVRGGVMNSGAYFSFSKNLAGRISVSVNKIDTVVTDLIAYILDILFA